MSGIFIKATAAKNAANAFIEDIVNEIKSKKEHEVNSYIGRLRWSWQGFKFVPKTREDVLNQWNLKSYFEYFDKEISDPFTYSRRSADCQKMLKIMKAAEHAEVMIPGSQILLSVEDHHLLKSYLG